MVKGKIAMREYIPIGPCNCGKEPRISKRGFEVEISCDCGEFVKQDIFEQITIAWNFMMGKHRQ